MKIDYIFKLLVIIVLLSSTDVTAQVTIGSGTPPEKGALLQLKDTSLESGVTATGGLLLPRVFLTEKKELYPMFLNASGSGPNSEYASKKADIDKAHTGLIVYNLNGNDEKGLCLGLNQWDGKQWDCFENSMGNAVGYITDCNDIQISGLYKSNESLNSGHFMTVTLEITKEGAYLITARAAQAENESSDNGYFFTTSGVFLTPGKYTVQIPGGGTPLKFTPSGNPGDYITVSLNNKPLSLKDGKTCEIRQTVEDSSKKPLYTIDCSNTKVYGLYKVNQSVNSTNYIEVTIHAESEALGSAYAIETNEVEGLSFSAQGIITKNQEVIKLVAKGAPTNTNKKMMTIKTNSAKSVATCEATVVVSIPKKKILAIASAALYNVSSTSCGGNVLIKNKLAFGTLDNSVFGLEDCEISSIVTVTPSESEVNTQLNKKPDIVITGYDTYFTSAVANLLKDYVNKGGVLLFFCQGEGNGAQNVMRAIFNNSSIQQRLFNGRGAIYDFPLAADPVLNGPFGDIRGRVWGEDASLTCGVTNVPVEDIEIYSTGFTVTRPVSDADAGSLIAFRHKKLNFLFVGDGGFISYLPGNVIDTGAYPFKLDQSTKLPIGKNRYGEGASIRPGTFTVYNSVFFANALAWAIQQAEFNGINTVK